MEEKRIVLRVEEGDDRREIYATTYQMRNPFHQFADGVASELDAFNYFSLSRAADLCPKAGRVLDLCCGRGLLIPFLRYRNRQPSAYVGVDLKSENAAWRFPINRDPRRRGHVEMNESWHFPRIFIEGSVGAGLTGRVLEGIKDEEAFQKKGFAFDLIVFTSAIEHMQPEAQIEALSEASRLINLKGRMYLTCPITPEDRDGYACQYAAHIYEPKESELKIWLGMGGWEIESEIGLVTKINHLKKTLRPYDLETARNALAMGPREQMLPLLAMMFPYAATEKAYICKLNTVGKKKTIKAKPPAAGGLLEGLK